MPSLPALLCCAGQVPYPLALQWQMELVQQRLANPDLPDVLLLLEHPPVYTLGRGASLTYLRSLPLPFPVHSIGRGGEVTHHCPGQVVGYPILNLQRHQPDLHWYLRQLEQVLMEVLGSYGIAADRKPGLTGVWVGETKVAALGIQVKRWITCHGFALNVCPDLTGFEAIVPCGIADYPVGSMEQFKPDLSRDAVQQQIIKYFSQGFNLEFQTQTCLEMGFLETL
jgi:lipoyl(octanoyl) transferase